MNKGTYVRRGRVHSKTCVEKRERINLSLILSGTVLILPQLGFADLFLFSSGQANKIHRKDGKRRAMAEAECSLWMS